MTLRSLVSPFVAVSALAAAAALIGTASPSVAAPKPVLGPESSVHYLSGVGASSAAKAGAWKVDVAPSGACKAGTECKAELKLVTEGEYHINKEYPYKVNLPESTDALKISKSVLKRADGVFDEHKAVFIIAVTPAKAGKQKLPVKFSMSACSAKDCLMEKVDLEVDIDVK